MALDRRQKVAQYHDYRDGKPANEASWMSTGVLAPRRNDRVVANTPGRAFLQNTAHDRREHF
jgi:hypothetical protein